MLGDLTVDVDVIKNNELSLVSVVKPLYFCPPPPPFFNHNTHNKGDQHVQLWFAFSKHATFVVKILYPEFNVYIIKNGDNIISFVHGMCTCMDINESFILNH